MKIDEEENTRPDDEDSPESEADEQPSRFNIRSSLFTAMMVAAIAIVWLASGYIRDMGQTSLIDEKPASPSISARDLPKVRTRISIAEDKRPEIIIRGGKIEADRTVIARAEIGGKVVAAASTKEGTFVEKGDLLCGIAIDNRLSEKEEAEAMMRLRNLQLSAAKKLAKQGHNTRMSLAQTQANYNKAIAMLDKAKRALVNTEITAPFDGILEKLYANEGDFLNPGAPCAKVIDMSPVVISGHLTEEEVAKIKLDDAGWATLSDGHKLKGYVRYIAHSADPKTRTYRIELEATTPNSNSSQAIRDGLTVQITLPLKKVRAHRIQPAILTLNAIGKLGLRIIIRQEDKNIVRFQPIKIILGHRKYYWISGLPESAQIIIVGQEYVRDGSEVLVERIEDNDEIEENDENLARPKENPNNNLEKN